MEHEGEENFGAGKGGGDADQHGAHEKNELHDSLFRLAEWPIPGFESGQILLFN